MSTAKRRRGQSLHLELPNAISGDLPPVAATFLILFDTKAGYTIVWERSIPGLELTDSVEFKSLPSGLHDVEEDLIYFLHNDQYAGISAFVNEPAAKSERNALMLAVGALVPLSQGRLGRSWEHAQGLRNLARELAQDTSETQPLEDFWEKHRWRDGDGSERPALDHDSSSSKEPAQNPSDANGYARRRSRVLSSASGLIQPDQFLPSHHPALSLPAFLDTFGPLIFPLYKSALLRKRILLVAHAPVEQTCNFVYDISVLSHIPASIFELLPLEPLPTRLQPLFSVGVHDIPTLRQGSRNPVKPTNDASTQDLGYGWVACTTDDVLATKEGLYDILVTIPPPYTAQAKEKPPSATYGGIRHYGQA
ncbi:Protein of unknown function DUF2347 [Lasallia pustulata]|uniref:DUF4484 domain-containing protein n=1 Tax=Lasallia pustulata TaxID=136370 RepID=A0A1W5D5R5_9LECA|nr:Protein of unknown function DUF2347 [Lasallia pustulata]